MAGIQFVSQEATGLLRALQQEREMAQRIATSLQQLRSRQEPGGRSGAGAA